MPLPEQEYEDEHSQNGALQILYLAVSGSLHAMFVLHYVGGRNAARGLEVLQRENIRLLVTCEDPSLTARHITEAYHLPEGMITLLDQEQCSALTPAQPDETARCCMLHDKGFASLIGGLRAAEKAQNAETSATTVQMVSVWFSVVIGVLLTYAGSIGTLSVAAVLMYQAAWSALSIAVCALKQLNPIYRVCCLRGQVAQIEKEHEAYRELAENLKNTRFFGKQQSAVPTLHLYPVLLNRLPSPDY